MVSLPCHVPRIRASRDRVRRPSTLRRQRTEEPDLASVHCRFVTSNLDDESGPRTKSSPASSEVVATGKPAGWKYRLESMVLGYRGYSPIKLSVLVGQRDWVVDQSLSCLVGTISRGVGLSCTTLD